MNELKPPYSLLHLHQESLRRLEVLADPQRTTGSAEDAAFADDMLLRLRLWAADVQLDHQLFEWATRLGPISAALRDMLDELRQAIAHFEDSLGSVETSKSPDQNGSAKDKLKSAVARLIDDSILLKAANSVPPEERTDDRCLQLNDDFKRSSLVDNVQHAIRRTYFLLDRPLPGDMLDRLLGAVVLNVKSPLPNIIPGDSSQRPLVTSVHTHSVSDVQMNQSYTQKYQSEAGTVGVSVKFERSRSSRFEFRAERMTTTFFEPSMSYINQLTEKYTSMRDALRSHRKCYLITGVKTARFKVEGGQGEFSSDGEEDIVCLRYSKIYRAQWWKPGPKLRSEPYTAGALF